MRRKPGLDVQNEMQEPVKSVTSLLLLLLLLLLLSRFSRVRLCETP